jgi:CspA family cold shock protein
MATGTIKTISDRGFGFISPDEGREDIFFHRSALVEVTIEELRQGERVSYSSEPDTRGRGMRAVGVRRSS